MGFVFLGQTPLWLVLLVNDIFSVYLVFFLVMFHLLAWIGAVYVFFEHDCSGSSESPVAHIIRAYIACRHWTIAILKV